MRVSVFIASHKPNEPYVRKAVQSVLDQTFVDWELVLAVPSGTQILLPADDRIKIAPCDCVLNGVGSAKRWAVENCSGEILVELDHDDILMPEALERIVETFDKNPEASLVYSDFAQITEDGDPDFTRFNVDNGWEYDNVDGWLRCRAMPPTPHNVSLIWYAPNHVRAFDREAYDNAGGYNADLKVLDDQDLMMRLWEMGDFVHIPELLYLQRMHSANTQRDRETNAFIQQDTIRQYDMMFQRCALAWAERAGLLAVDLGCGPSLPEGYAGFDLVHGRPLHTPRWTDAKLTGNRHIGDVFQWDLSKGIPLPDNSVGVIRAVDFLEHLPHDAGIMAEIHRVLAPNGLLLSLTPSTDGRGAWQDPTHVSGWNENSFWYYTDPQYATFSPQTAGAPKFQISRLVTYFPSDWHRQNQIPYICANLIAVKDGYVRNGGPLLWR